MFRVPVKVLTACRVQVCKLQSQCRLLQPRAPHFQSTPHYKWYHRLLARLLWLQLRLAIIAPLFVLIVTHICIYRRSLSICLYRSLHGFKRWFSWRCEIFSARYDGIFFTHLAYGAWRLIWTFGGCNLGEILKYAHI
jgi:hypothetical protein